MMKTHKQWLFEAPFTSLERQQLPVYIDFEDELEGSVSSVLHEGRGALSRRQEDQIIRQAIQAGIRDANQLTNRVFSARYPKRQGRKLNRNEPNFRQLSQEWLAIRTHLVLPALQSLPSRQPTAPPTIPPALFKPAGTTPLLEPVGTTLYVKIPLGGESPALPMTGIFIPSGYRVNSQVDLIIYLHGNHRDTFVKGKNPAPDYTPETLSIDQHWNAAFYPYFAFREGVNASGKNVILVAPTLGPRSQSERLIKPGGFDAYVNQVMASLNAHGSHKQLNKILSVRNIILACHSGGGWPMRQIASSKEKYAANIRECWGFDCTYNTGDDTEWVKWAIANPSRRLFIYYLDIKCLPPKPPSCSTQYRACSLKNLAKKLDNVRVIIADKAVATFKGSQPGRNHNWVPITYWEKRIKAASFLLNR